ncbi:uromodulin-like 1 [Brachyistius frenatus]|uniref:uromodulin-like 1 n=1 Tax=Brachyistius frenatus TaxID=100188 RepID=UPI0037E92FC3
MSWMLSIWVAAALLPLCVGQNTEQEGNSLSLSGYHLCTCNKTRTASFLVVHRVPYTVSQTCGGWLLWKTCTVTLYRMIHQTEFKTVEVQVTGCCDGYVQVGRYCALSGNRRTEFTAKPGSCPNTDGLCPRSEDCELDIGCPGWQKCCQRYGRSLCFDPAANSSENGRNRWNATVTVKEDYHQLMSEDEGLLNHTRLLQAMVTGALQFEIPIYYLSSWPVHPYRTATSLLIDCSATLSLYNVTSKLHLLLKHIEEVSSVTVQDVNECVHPALRQCSLQADCNNTVGSYQCVCHQGFIDVNPSNPGTRCTADDRVSTTTEHPVTNTTLSPAPSTTQDSPGNSSAGIFNSSETSTTSSSSSVLYNSSHALPWTSFTPHTSLSSTVDSPLLTTTCSPPSISSLQSTNVTGTSFSVYWSGHFQTNQTYQVFLSKGSEVNNSWDTNQTLIEVTGLLPGVIYSVTITPRACGSQGVALRVSVKTDAQSLDATARLTNIEFTDDLQNTSSRAYKNLTESIVEEIYQSLSPEMKYLVNSDQVRIEIRSFSLGSVVVNFTIIFIPSQSQDISNVSIALLHSLINSSKYTVDENNTSINDFNECAPGENDCSQWATCTNTWASYTCVCLVGFIDNDPERPGRACQAVTMETTTLTVPQITPSSSDPAVTTVTTSPGINTLISSGMLPRTVSSIAQASTTITTPTTTTTATPTTTTSPTTTTATPPTTTTTTPTTTTATPTTSTTTPTTSTTPTTTTATPTTTTTTTPTTTTATPTTTTTLTTTTATPTTTTTLTTTTATPPTTTTIPTTTTTQTTTTATPTTPTTMATAPPTTTTTPITTTSTTTTTDPALTTNANITTTTITTPTIITSNTQTSSAPTTSTTNTSLTTTTTSSTPTTSPPTTSMPTTTNGSMLGALSVQCRVGAITVTVAKDFLLNAKIHESALYLGLLGCSVNGGNATHVQLTVAWNECATSLVHNETYYTATVTLFNTMDLYSPSRAEEVPRILLEVPIMCTYMKSMLISADFGLMGYDMIKDVIVGSGSFRVTLQLMNGIMPLPHNYSLSSNQAVVVEVSLNTSSEQIKLVINKCWGTPTLNPEDTYSYTFLENSCSLNTYTKVLMNGNSSTSRVSVQIFSFVNLKLIYLHCQVQICLQIGSDTCVPDCLQRTARSSNLIGRGFGSLGPIVKSDEESLDHDLNTLHVVGFSCLGIGLSLFFIVGFVCLFYYQRNRIRHYNFSVKPKQENFTYLIFNT